MAFTRTGQLQNSLSCTNSMILASKARIWAGMEFCELALLIPFIKIKVQTCGQLLPLPGHTSIREGYSFSIAGMGRRC